METFYNTTSESGQQLRENTLQALTQDAIIYEMFCHYKRLSPSQCLQKYSGFMCNIVGKKYVATPPLTSIRRSINTLMNENLLDKTCVKRIGMFARSEYIWELKVDPSQQKS